MKGANCWLARGLLDCDLLNVPSLSIGTDHKNSLRRGRACRVLSICARQNHSALAVAPDFSCRGQVGGKSEQVPGIAMLALIASPSANRSTAPSMNPRRSDGHPAACVLIKAPGSSFPFYFCLHVSWTLSIPGTL